MFLGPGSRYKPRMMSLWRALFAGSAGIGNIGLTLSSTDMNFSATGRLPTVFIGPNSSQTNEVVNIVGPAAGGANINFFVSSGSIRQAAIQAGFDSNNSSQGGEIRLYTTSSAGLISQAVSINNRGQFSIGVNSTGGLTVGSTATTLSGVINGNVGYTVAATAASSLQTFLRGNGTVFASDTIHQADITLYAHANLGGL